MSCQPELLSGSVRENLDPGTELDDVYLNDALRSSGLYYSDENRITLDTLVAAGGTNLSFGQRQMLAFARAMVRQSKLLILDEGALLVDYRPRSMSHNELAFITATSGIGMSKQNNARNTIVLNGVWVRLRD